jgi:hypothetical protein
MAEIKAFCKKRSIPHTIAVEASDGSCKRIGEDDRKDVILERMRHFLKTGVVLPDTYFPASVVSFDAFPEEVSTRDRLHYGQYDKTNCAMLAILKDLTGGMFKDGALARMLAPGILEPRRGARVGSVCVGMAACNQRTHPAESRVGLLV